MDARGKDMMTVILPAWAWDLIEGAASEVAEGATIYEPDERASLSDALDTVSTVPSGEEVSKPTFKVCVTQMVEQTGTFEVKAASIEEAIELAKDGRDLWQECENAGTWGNGDDADKARAYAIITPDGETVDLD